jgi:hypothetical protein
MIWIKSRPPGSAYRTSMLVQHLVIVTTAEGVRQHYPLVCQPHEIFDKAQGVLASSGGVSADVWRGAERIYSLNMAAE